MRAWLSAVIIDAVWAARGALGVLMEVDGGIACEWYGTLDSAMNGTGDDV